MAEILPSGGIGGALSFPNVYDSSGAGKTSLRRWRAALADALYGRAVINVLGDSIAVGTGADGSPTYVAANDPTYRTQGWVGQLRSLFQTVYGDPGEGAIFGKDPLRVALGGGAAFSSSVGPLEGGVSLNAAGNTATWTLPVCTEIDIWTWDGSSGTLGDGTYQVDGGAAVGFTPGTGSGAAVTYRKTTITGLASTTHTLQINRVANGVFVACVAARKQTTGVQVNRFAVPGNTTANLVGLDAALNGNASGQTRMIAASVGAPAANLVIIELAVNDFTNQNSLSPALAQPGTIPTQTLANITTMATAAIAAGACVLIVGEPRQNAVSYPTPMTYTEPNYYAPLRAYAQATDHVAFLDLPEVWGSNVAGQTLALYNSGSVHPTRKGHGDIARIVYSALTRQYEEAVAG